ncbi:hypothetical protein LTR28_002581, partial [Elasticomyces elasticus]
ALSAFGSHGDLLPDELSEQSKTTQPNSSQDLESLERMAAAIARARGLDPKDILPKLAELFYAGDSIERYQSRLASLGTTNRAAPSRANILPMESLSLDHGTKHTADHPVCVDELAGQPAVQIVTTSGRGKRRFSFEAGDDMVMFETEGGRLAPSGASRAGLRSCELVGPSFTSKLGEVVQNSKPHLQRNSCEAKERGFYIESDDSNQTIEDTTQQGRLSFLFASQHPFDVARRILEQYEVCLDLVFPRGRLRKDLKKI